MTSSSSAAPRPPRPPQPPSKTPPAAAASYSLFPPIPAPLQRLFDRVPLVTYPPNALPCAEADGRDGYNEKTHKDPGLPTLYVFIDPADAVCGRASFNPTCLKWQTFLRFAGVPVRLAASNNHASPSGALPFLLPPQQASTTAAATVPSAPVPAHRLLDYAETHGRRRRQHPPPQQPEEDTSPPPSPLLDNAAAYTALLDTAVRRAWLHAVYLTEDIAVSGSRPWSAPSFSSSSIATRLYADAASVSPLVRAALARELRTAAAKEVYNADTSASSSSSSSSSMARSALEEIHIYSSAEAAFSALATLLAETAGETGDYFFGHTEPTLFDAHVFSYTHLLLEDDDQDATTTDLDSPSSSPKKRFSWRDRRLPDLVRAQPHLVRHRNQILARYWPANAAVCGMLDSTIARTASNPADSVSWVKV